MLSLMSPCLPRAGNAIFRQSMVLSNSCSHEQTSSSLTVHPLSPQHAGVPIASRHLAALRSHRLRLSAQARGWACYQSSSFSVQASDNVKSDLGPIKEGEDKAPRELPPLPTEDVTYLGPLSAQHKLLKVCTVLRATCRHNPCCPLCVTIHACMMCVCMLTVGKYVLHFSAYFAAHQCTRKTLFVLHLSYTCWLCAWPVLPSSACCPYSLQRISITNTLIAIAAAPAIIEWGNVSYVSRVALATSMVFFGLITTGKLRSLLLAQCMHAHVHDADRGYWAACMLALARLAAAATGHARRFCC